MSLSCTVSKIVNVKEWRSIEICVTVTECIHQSIDIYHNLSLAVVTITIALLCTIIVELFDVK